MQYINYQTFYNDKLTIINEKIELLLWHQKQAMGTENGTELMHQEQINILMEEIIVCLSSFLSAFLPLDCIISFVEIIIKNILKPTI